MSRVFLGLAGLAAATVVAAGCGGGGSKVSAGSSKPATATKATPTSVRIIEANNATLGRVLEDAQGKVLYTYTADVGGKIGCTGVCLTYWPPVLLPAGQKAAIAGPGVSGLGIVASPEGPQVTFRGHPLYTYVADTRPGEASGDNVVDSGGKWLVATLAAPSTPATTAPKVPATAPATTSAPATTDTTAAHPVVPMTSPPMTAAPMTSPPVTRAPVPTTRPTAPPTSRAPAPTTPPTAPPTTSAGGGPSY
jgi:predicted lipoprotein with Yx(FWY)xxD motif